MSNMHVAASIAPLSRLFNPSPASAGMAQIATVKPDSGASSAPTEPVHVDPITKDNLSTKGKMFTWRNPVAGQGTFVQQDGGGANSLPNSMGA